MIVSVEIITVGLARIEGKTVVKYPGRTTETFRLEHLEPITSFTVQCRAKNISPHDNVPVFFTLTEKSLTNVNTSDKSASAVKTENQYSSVPRKPSKVWIAANGASDTDLLKEVSHTGKWVSCYYYFMPVKRNDLYYETKLELDWTIWLEFPTQKPGEQKLLRRLTSLFSNQTGCDVQFKFGDDQIGGHTAIVSTASPVFAAMFKHGMKEAETRQVVIEDISFHIFKHLLFYIYSGRISGLLKENSAKLLFQAAHKYEIADLMDDCINFIITCIRLDNVLALLSWAKPYSADKLNNAALVFIGQNSQEVYEQEEWGKFIQNQPDLSLTVTRYVMKLTVDILKSENVDCDALINGRCLT